jgi:hypothetical protein
MRILASVIATACVFLAAEAQAQATCKVCAEQRQACMKNYSGPACATEYKMCMKSCKK